MQKLIEFFVQIDVNASNLLDAKDYYKLKMELYKVH